VVGEALALLVAVLAHRPHHWLPRPPLPHLSDEAQHTRMCPETGVRCHRLCQVMYQRHARGHSTARDNRPVSDVVPERGSQDIIIVIIIIITTTTTTTPTAAHRVGLRALSAEDEGVLEEDGPGPHGAARQQPRRRPHHAVTALSAYGSKGQRG
jgi:hypothetical protein